MISSRKLSGLSIILACAAAIIPCPAEDTAPVSAPTATASVQDQAKDLLSKASEADAAQDLDEAVDDADRAVQLDPHNASAFELRGSIYIEKKLWDRAERDYTTANQISPDVAYRYKLADIKFLEKSYGDARFRFTALQGDARLGDLATYKIFLCDMLGSHESIAANDLNAIDRAGKTPPYFFAHIAWDLYHNQRAEAAKFYKPAQSLYGDSTCQLYLSSLISSQQFRPLTATFVSKDGRKFNKAAVFLESDGLRVSSEVGWITLPLEQIPDDLSPFPDDIRDQIAKKRAVVPESTTPVSLVSFTTKSGKVYESVRWRMEVTGLAVLTSEGWTTVPYQQLPSDLSPFPPDLQQSLAQQRASTAEMPIREATVSFQTKSGKDYDQVRATLSDQGLHILTTNGWIAISFADLPHDLSPFPAEWCMQIRAELRAGPRDSGQMNTVSFTTKNGKHYDQVRAALENTGLRLLTPKGLIGVPFDQLPDDISIFPEAWQETILMKRKSAVSSSQVGEATP